MPQMDARYPPARGQQLVQLAPSFLPVLWQGTQSSCCKEEVVSSSHIAGPLSSSCCWTLDK